MVQANQTTTRHFGEFSSDVPGSMDSKVVEKPNLPAHVCPEYERNRICRTIPWEERSDGSAHGDKPCSLLGKELPPRCESKPMRTAVSTAGSCSQEPGDRELQKRKNTESRHRPYTFHRVIQNA